MFLVSSCSCLCPIHWSHVLSWEWRCSWSSADRRCSNYSKYIACYGATYIRDFTVVSWHWSGTGSWNPSSWEDPFYTLAVSTMVRRQGISNNAIDPILMEYADFSTLGLPTSAPQVLYLQLCALMPRSTLMTTLSSVRRRSLRWKTMPRVTHVRCSLRNMTWIT